MAYGDIHFSYVQSGSTATSVAGAHNLFGVYGGLSLLNNDDVVFATVFASAADIRISASAASPATNDQGLRITIAGSNYDLPPIRVGTASQMTFARDSSNNNASPHWTLWVRNR